MRFISSNFGEDDATAEFKDKIVFIHKAMSRAKD